MRNSAVDRRVLWNQLPEFVKRLVCTPHAATPLTTRQAELAGPGEHLPGHPEEGAVCVLTMDDIDADNYCECVQANRARAIPCAFS